MAVANAGALNKWLKDGLVLIGERKCILCLVLREKAAHSLLGHNGSLQKGFADVDMLSLLVVFLLQIY